MVFHKNVKKLEFLLFLQNIEQFRLDNKTNEEKQDIRKFLSLTTLNINDFPSDDEIISFYKINVQKK